MRKLLAVLALVTSCQTVAAPVTCDVFDTMVQSQVQVLEDSYTYGLDYDYEWILPAIAWKESSAGLDTYRPDIRGGSHGVYQALLDNVLWREFEMRLEPKLDDNGEPLAVKAPQIFIDWTIIQLQNNQAFAAKHAILELQFWHARSDTDWLMLTKYNGGYAGPKINDAKVYANKVLHYRKLLKTCKKSPLYGLSPVR